MPKLDPPRSSAVICSSKLQPNAVARGVTYAGILKEAKNVMDLEGLGIQAIRFRRALTGARILGVPGATSGDKANLLADKLPQVVSHEFAEASRPDKYADLRISGLDEAFEKTEVVEAISRIGECLISSVKVGEIRMGLSGLEMVVVGRQCESSYYKPRPLPCACWFFMSGINALERWTVAMLASIVDS